jgi:hypothetical protein
VLSITHELVRRLESAEAEDGAACVHAQKQLNPEAGAHCEPFSSGYLLFVGTDSPLTHALGLGFNGPITAEDLHRMETFFRSRGSAATVDVCPFADFSLVELLSQRGYKISEFANVMVRGIAREEQVPEIAGAPQVRLADPSEAELYGDTVVRGFFGRDEVTPEESNLGRVLFHMPDGLAYFGVIDNVPVSCGQMAIHNGVASCFGDSTLIAYRRRGAHTAIIRARVVEASARGCDLITAGVSPGSTSQRDYERVGFQVAYTKLTMVHQ